MLKIRQNWGKIANYPPNAQQRFAPLRREDRPYRGQGQECSRPRTKDTCGSVLQKKRFSEKFFRRSPEKNIFQKIFQSIRKISTTQKIVLFSSREQGNFRGLQALRPSPRTSKCVLEDSTSGGKIARFRVWVRDILALETK